MLITASVLLLSVAGIYALMSCTVSLRRREIGIRSALGAEPGSLIRGVLSKAAGQIAIGIAIGIAIAGILAQSTIREGMDRRDITLLLGTAAFMMAVGLIAAVGPARRALRIQPKAALQVE